MASAKQIMAAYAGFCGRLKVLKFNETFSPSGCRCYGSKVSKKYSDTVFVPYTSFENYHGRRRVEREKFIQGACDFHGLYDWQRQQTREKTFVLHDGPPYANGQPHFGHALNKILKDITVRYKMMRGFKVHYVPGWDCHGLPIELKAEADSMSNKALVIRRKARDFAEKWVQAQSGAFQSWGLVGDWDRPYVSYSTEFIASELDLFFRLYEEGYILREYKPVHWSYASRSALADAELVFNEKHKSPSVYIKFRLKQLPGLDLNPVRPVSALVWTTNPWTIPANRAICYSPSKTYCLVSCGDSNELLIIASELKSVLEQILSKNFRVVMEFGGSALRNASYHHPLTGSEYRFLPADHVAGDKGTGLVHTAPAHGPEDFTVALEHQIPVECLVGEDLRYEEAVGTALAGKFVLSEGSDQVMKLLGEHVVHVGSIVHTYPYDWRTNTPVILRASLQWFISTDRIKELALRCLDDIEIHPSSKKAEMKNSLVRRPFWCISRQRTWGVPIPVFYESTSRKAILSRPILNHLLALLRQHGPDFWWSLPQEELLPASVLLESCFQTDAAYERGNDILDIWFDSGSSWYHVLQDVEGSVADLYLEGTDQLGGWFQTSLLTSCALRRTAPYRSLYFHGFTLDDKGRKMSKSLGNVVDPDTAINGGDNQQKEPAYGIDVLRWWTTLHGTSHTNVAVASWTLADALENYNKLRLTLKYLLGLLNDFDVVNGSMPLGDMRPLDRYLLHQLYHFKKEMTQSYDKYAYHNVGAGILRFVVNNVSKSYLHLVKDRVYCDGLNDVQRRSCQAAVCHSLTILCEVLGPLMPFLCEDVYLSRPDGLKTTNSCTPTGLFHTLWSPVDDAWNNPDLAATMSRVFSICDAVNRRVAAERLKLRDLDVVLYVTDGMTPCSDLKALQADEESCHSSLCEILQVARVIFAEQSELKISNPGGHLVSGSVTPSDLQNGTFSANVADGSYSLVLRPSSRSICERCRRRTKDASDSRPVCSRCDDVLLSLQSSQ